MIASVGDRFELEDDSTDERTEWRRNEHMAQQVYLPHCSSHSINGFAWISGIAESPGISGPR